jgi:hypothetical protein
MSESPRPSELQESLRALAQLRRKEAEAAAMVAQALAALDATPEASVLRMRQAMQREAADLRQSVERLVREMAVAHYQATGNKAPAPGLGIRVGKRLVYDAGEALAWCKEHAPNYVRLEERLDAVRFEAGAATLEGAPVEVQEVPSASLARDLSDYLGH